MSTGLRSGAGFRWSPSPPSQPISEPTPPEFRLPPRAAVRRRRQDDKEVFTGLAHLRTCRQGWMAVASCICVSCFFNFISHGMMVDPGAVCIGIWQFGLMKYAAVVSDQREQVKKASSCAFNKGVQSSWVIKIQDRICSSVRAL
ncbi:hypothetical protein GUJ93_ZPchr0006g44230 [Zizania palustris]|uniref:Uncharacterized protein n=1 Tax=Zizania palustris TaxID=103762 RepID=A0A8J5W1W0_ZIZPA|nr:hypothetical protein GUJ93_ZPchr0006g44230 [Zizania palustris]